jgi:hypothetical protein
MTMFASASNCRRKSALKLEMPIDGLMIQVIPPSLTIGNEDAYRRFTAGAVACIHTACGHRRSESI